MPRKHWVSQIRMTVGDSSSQFIRTSTGTCTTTTITNWAKDISAFIKSIDSNHLVAIGDEGFFNQPGNPSYPYQGGEGVDFDANLAISSIDFGTFHVSI